MPVIFLVGAPAPCPDWACPHIPYGAEFGPWAWHSALDLFQFLKRGHTATV